MLKLRLANGRSIPCDLAPSGQAFRDWLATGGPVLLGTMHVGVSDMLGFQLGGREKRRVYLVRQRVGNSHDTERLAARFGDWLRFVWVNDPGEMLFALKAAAATGDAIALQCDRVEFTTRTEAFDFLGARRLFPVTIYHLARIFERPVILTVGLPTPAGRSRLYGSPRFDPVPGEPRERGGGAGARAFPGFSPPGRGTAARAAVPLVQFHAAQPAGAGRHSPGMKRTLQRGYYVGACYVSWLAFALVGLGLNVGCGLLLLLPRRAGRGTGVRRAIRRLFDLWRGGFTPAACCASPGAVSRRPLTRGTIYIANHPTLLDATLLLARLPDAVCIFKPSLMRNPAIGPAAIMAGYIAGENGVDLVHEVAARIAPGNRC
jgi:hypothetical protein